MRILLVDDETDLRELYKMTLEEKKYEVVEAENGQAAQELLAKGEKFDLIISDMRMPKMTGPELYKWIREKKLDAKILFVTAFSESPETKAVYDLGNPVPKFLTKPVPMKTLLSEVENLLQGGSDTAEAEEGTFARIPVEEFISGKVIAYPIYMRMADQRYLKIAHTGEDLSKDRILKIKEKGINEFWLTLEDFKKYQDISKKLLGAVISNSNFKVDKQMQLARHACSVAGESLRACGLNYESLKSAEETMEIILKTSLSGKEVSDSLFDQINSLEQATFSHASICGMLTAMMMKIMDWSSQKNVMAVTMAAFLHDIGMSKLPEELQHKPVKRMTAQELELYHQHPLLGAEMLKESGLVGEDLIKSVLQHHEDVRGSGFPKRMSRSEIFPMSRIVFLVDQFADLLAIAKPEERKMPDKILDALLLMHRGAFDQHAVKALHLALTSKTTEAAKKSFKLNAG